MRYDLYKDDVYVATYEFPEGQQPTLHPNKGRLLKYDPPAFDPATQVRELNAVTSQTTGSVSFTVRSKTNGEQKSYNKKQAQQALDALDSKLPRFVEDLLETLVAKALLTEAELTGPAKALLQNKRAERQKVQNNS